MAEPRRRYAIVGTGARAVEMYARPLLGPFADRGELVAMYDPNPLRASSAAELAGGGERLLADGFDGLLAARPDVVVVCSKDSTHDHYISRALAAGCDVLTEKPLAIDEHRVARILRAQRASGRDVRVAFNYRYAPLFGEVKRLLAAGAVGHVHGVDLHWYLDTRHGADYFRRWHRRMADSGGLLVHKACHHFDLIGWWLGDRPEAVCATASRRVYGPTRRERGVRCRGCAYRTSCEFAWDAAADEELRRLYLEAEAADGYHRDGCVFAEEIDIADTAALVARYAGGAQLAYSLVAYAPYEGVRAAFTGTHGRLELDAIESFERPSDWIEIHRDGGRVERIDVPRADGHGGGDARLLESLFGDAEDGLGERAGLLDGAYASLTGIAANRSVERGGWVAIEELLPS